MLGQDFDMTDEQRAERDAAADKERRCIRVTSDGTPIGTRVETTDGVNLGEYGLVAVQWNADAHEPGQLTAVFFAPIVDITTPMPFAQVLDMRCTCSPSHWGETWYNRPSEVAAFETLYEAIVAVGPHHSDGCARREQLGAQTAAGPGDGVQ